MTVHRHACFTLLLTALAANAQTPPTDKTTAPPALVQLQVAAMDRGGAPIRDLSVTDFEISDQGKPQQILNMHRVEPDAAPAPPSPGDYSNEPTSPPPVVILFDLLNEGQPDRLDLWKRLDHSLPQLQSGANVYFYLLTLEGVLQPIHAIGGSAAESQTWNKNVSETLDKAMKADSHERPAGLDQEDAVKKTYVALETLANQLATLPGRRNILWVTDSMPNVWNPKIPCSGDWVDCALYVPHLSVTLDRDKVAVNPLSYTPTPDLRRDLDFMSGLTGGRTYIEEDPVAALQQINKAAIGTYAISYAPAPESFDGKFHVVRVACSRDGTKLQAKVRYYAYRDQRPAAARQEASMITAYKEPADSPDIGLHVTSSSSAGTGKSVHLQIRIDPADLTFMKKEDKLSDGVTLVIADLGANGPIGNPTMSSFNLTLSEAQRTQLAKDGIPLAQDHPLKDGEQKIRILILDQNSATVGSITIPAPTPGT